MGKVLAVGVVVGLACAGLAQAGAVRIGAPAPEIAGARWINSAPLTSADLRGRVVLVEFWTYG